VHRARGRERERARSRSGAVVIHHVIGEKRVVSLKRKQLIQHIINEQPKMPSSLSLSRTYRVVDCFAVSILRNLTQPGLLWGKTIQSSPPLPSPLAQKQGRVTVI